MPNRGLRSFQFGTSVRAGNDCAPAPAAPAGTDGGLHRLAQPVEPQAGADRDAVQAPLILHEEPEVGVELVDRAGWATRTASAIAGLPLRKVYDTGSPLTCVGPRVV